MDSKHVCKFCNKAFPSGRSLGGHIRSHLVHNNSNSGNASNKEPKLPKLRENPKKTNKAADFSLMSSSPSSMCTKSETEDGSDPNHGKRSIFVVGGNNSNSSVSEVVEPEKDEVAVAMSLIMLSRDLGKLGDISSSPAVESSGNVPLLLANNKNKRRRREKIQGKGSVPGADNSKNRSKKSENLEVSASGHLQNGSKIMGFQVSENGFASNDQSYKPHESKNSVSRQSFGQRTDKMELIAANEHHHNGSRLKEFEVFENGFASNDQATKSSERKRKVTDPNNMNKKLWCLTSGQVKNGSKMKEFEVSEDGSASNDQNQNNQTELSFHEIAMGAELLSNNITKRSKFECTTCNKVFHSYQALGGHRASHKKLAGMKPSPPTKLESNDKDFLSPPPPNDHHHQQHQIGEIGIGNLSSSSSRSTTIIKVSQKHECPICFRNFPSGQALGGHKRSHLLAAYTSTTTTITTNDSNKNITVMKKLPSSEMRDFFDLNLPPAAPEEEATIPNNLVELIKPYWWVESSHKHEPLLGLISN